MDEDGNCKQQLRYLKRKMVRLIFSEKNSFVNFLPHLSTVPKAIRPDTKSTVCLRLTYHRTEGQEPTFHHSLTWIIFERGRTDTRNMMVPQLASMATVAGSQSKANCAPLSIGPQVFQTRAWKSEN